MNQDSKCLLFHLSYMNSFLSTDSLFLPLCDSDGVAEQKGSQVIQVCLF